MLDVVNLICWIEKLCVCTYVPKWPNHLKDLDLRMSGTLPPRGPTSNTMNRGDMIPKMLKTVQLNVHLPALRVHAADEAIAFHLFHCDKMPAVKMIVHLHRQCFIADATGALSYQ